MNNSEVILSLLKTTQPFQLLPDSVQKSLVDLMTKFTFKKEELIYRQNVTDIEGIDLIYKGGYETFFLDTGENKHSIEIHHHPYCFGGISILLNRKKGIKIRHGQKGNNHIPIAP
ncbi:hypothetical protein OKW96_07590 [Sphingobacterium sp. KU25419]|nr:hypothetical protein OKW96_07590 [Sphingobacterium sp. KU25419]